MMRLICKDSFVFQDGHQRKHKKHRSQSDSPVQLKHRIKAEPESDLEYGGHSKYKQEPDLSRVKLEQDSDEERHFKHRRKHRDYDRGERPRSHDPDERNRRDDWDDRHRGRDFEDRKPHRQRVKQERQDDEYRNQREDRRRNDSRRRDNRERRDNFLEEQRYGRQEASASSETAVQNKDQPNFELSGKLTEDTNTYKGVVIKYNEPPEARKPKRKWRLYPFKNDEPLKPYHMHRQSAFLLGRDRIIADIPIDHPSCSKQHAVFQYRLVEYTKEDGRRGRKVAPYIIDLGSANGTFVNNKQIEAERYVELMEKDVIKFGFSSREYVLLHDNSDTTELDDDSS